MVRNCLSKKKIIELSKLLVQVFDYLKEMKKTNRLAEKIQFPKIPPILSESLVIHLIREKRLLKLTNIQSIEFGGKECDILVKTNSRNIKIEVKATGRSAFEYFGEKDITADFLIWVHFGDFFLNESTKNVYLFIIKNPAQYFNSPVKITLSQLKQKIGENLKAITVNIDNLGDEYEIN